MDSQDRAEVRELLLDVISGPLEKIDGQIRLLVQQSASIETQTLKTNGRVNDLDKWKDEVNKVIAKDLPHTIMSCPQATIINELKTDVNTLKTAKVEKSKFENTLRANLGTILVGTMLIITLTFNLLNFNRNNKQLVNQETLRMQIQKEIQMLKLDSLNKLN